MPPAIPAGILSEYLGLDDTASAYHGVHAMVSKFLAEYPRMHLIFDAPNALRRRKFKKLQNAVQRLAEADAALDEGDRFELAGYRHEGDRIVDAYPNLDVKGLVERLNAALSEALTNLQDTNYEGRPMKVARWDLARQLATMFQQHYRLAPKDYRANLADFLKALFEANNISCPKDVQTILELLPAELRGPQPQQPDPFG